MRRLSLVLLALAACRGSTTKQVMCPDGYEACDGECFNLQNDARHCGSCERACANNEECKAAVCQPVCPAGQHVCNGVCVSDAALETCGSLCTPCPQVAGGIATCDGKMCGAICDPNRRFCGGACADCPTGGVKCMGAQCVSSGCPAGQHLCNGECVDENGGSCGDSCLSCPMPPANGFQVCLNGGCEFLCRTGNRPCASGCCISDFMEVGAYHSCQVTPQGGVNCWGRNHIDDMTSGGALGDGTRIDRAQPRAVSMFTSGMVAVQPGEFHTCAMDQFGAVWCWGLAQGGRLGDGTTMSDKLTPAAVMGLGQGAAIAISAGGTGGCALSRGGEVKCWGENVHGEVGDGTTTARSAPVLVRDLGTTVVDVSFGLSHACALMRGGVVRCWGDNTNGQLGDGTQTERTRPVLVMGLFDIVRVSAGDRQTCAVRKGGEVVCWGEGYTGMAAIAEVTGATQVSVGGAHACALLGTGGVMCWGANESGQLGDGTTAGRMTAAAVMSISDGTSVSAGRAHTCARTRSGTRCWGNNEFGQLGDGSTTNRLIPVSTN